MSEVLLRGLFFIVPKVRLLHGSESHSSSFQDRGLPHPDGSLGAWGLLLETLRIDYRITQNDLRFNFNDPELQNVSRRIP